MIVTDNEIWAELRRAKRESDVWLEIWIFVLLATAAAGVFAWDAVIDGVMFWLL